MTERETLKLMARHNWRGMPTEKLVYQFQELQDSLAVVKDNPLTADNPYVYYAMCSLEALIAEVERRRNLKYTGIQNTNAETIQAIKSAIKIEDVLEWYTDVFLDKRQWTYRCTLHGPDKTPSGVIYRNDNRGWCFVCSQGGDVFDIVQLFERVTLPQAMAKLARHIGIDLRPISKEDIHSRPEYQGELPY